MKISKEDMQYMEEIAKSNECALAAIRLQDKDPNGLDVFYMVYVDGEFPGVGDLIDSVAVENLSKRFEGRRIMISEEKDVINSRKQLCVWRGTTLGEYTVEEFKDFFKKEFEIDIEYAEEVTTLPCDEKGEDGGRVDQLFWVKRDDMPKFAVKRLEYGISWWEDVVSYNNYAYQYPKNILDKYPITW